MQFPKLGNANDFIKEELDNNEIQFNVMDMNGNMHNGMIVQQGTPGPHSNSNTNRKGNNYRLESSASRRRIDAQQNYGLAKGMS